jgi:serine/threonine protein kinase
MGLPSRPNQGDPVQRAERIRRVVEDCGRRRAGGEEVSDETLLARHRELMPELAEELRKLRLIENARQQARQPSPFDPAPTVPAAEAPLSSGGDPPEDSAARPDIPGYDLLRPIGSGAFGEVWLARNRLDGHFCAVKVIPHSRAVELEGVRLYRQRANDHPYLVPILHVGEAEGFYYYVMPLADDVKGTAVLRSPEQYEAATLERHRADRGCLPVAEVLTVAEHLLSALERLHEGGVVHCDVKPANVLRLGGTWRLGDLGLMTAGERLRPDRGTPAFWPPEGPRDRTADLYGLGKTLYLLLTGADLGRFVEFAGGTLKVPGADPRAEGLRRVILRACHDDPARRFPGAGAMRQALAPLRAGRRPWWPVAVAATLLVAVAVALWLGLFSRPSVGPPPPVVRTPPVEGIPRDPDGKPLRQDFPLKAELIGARKDPDGPLYRIREGQLLSFRIESAHACYVGIWYKNDEDRVYQLFPNDDDPDHLVPAGTVRLIPGEKDYQIRAAPAKGPGRMSVLASTERWDPIKGHKDGPFVVFAKPEELDGLRNFVLERKTKAVSENVFLVQVGPR